MLNYRSPNAGAYSYSEAVVKHLEHLYKYPVTMFMVFRIAEG